MLDESFVKGMPKLGFGLMRLPRADKEKDIIDVDQTAQMADLFFQSGLKYCDSAYVYPGSEEAAREAIVKRHPRDSFYITSKLNVNAKGVNDEASAKAEFNESLKREGVDYINFYLLHALGKQNIQRFDDWHLWDYVKELKEQGKIKHYGFSFHDTPEFLDELLTKHPDAEFVQLQINYADWNNPAIRSRECYEVARKHGKPIIVMEPIKGGTLANPPKPVADLLKKENPAASCASWAVRFVASLPGIMVVLSGMSNVEQMQDNTSFMGDFKPLSAHEQEVIAQAQEILAGIHQIPCTKCHYCTGGCPMKINIPDLFAAMNMKLVYGNIERAKQSYARDTGEGHGRASDCVQCGQCEMQCPQHIEIRSWLKQIAETLE
ncbi:MAG: aldo/keto reductase [Solobacterium sp.]|nr:aldo/keto reductase [Solobacterium sp.]MCH4206349.1 aldo/keto reductase [Solobacterium sp.]MCH4227851.1 aldo/keto reductase [Solobacterium sp.]MCH4283256.1 aldo/keto reductase [Solobacterium sp.]